MQANIAFGSNTAVWRPITQQFTSDRLKVARRMPFQLHCAFIGARILLQIAALTYIDPCVRAALLHSEPNRKYLLFKAILISNIYTFTFILGILRICLYLASYVYVMILLCRHKITLMSTTERGVCYYLSRYSKRPRTSAGLRKRGLPDRFREGGE